MAIGWFIRIRFTVLWNCRRRARVRLLAKVEVSPFQSLVEAIIILRPQIFFGRNLISCKLNQTGIGSPPVDHQGLFKDTDWSVWNVSGELFYCLSILLDLFGLLCFIWLISIYFWIAKYTIRYKTEHDTFALT